MEFHFLIKPKLWANIPSDDWKSLRARDSPEAKKILTALFPNKTILLKKGQETYGCQLIGTIPTDGIAEEFQT